jgi:hypothetical protein
LKELITALTTALQNDNTAAIRALGREYKQTPEQLTFALLESAGLLYASGKEPKNSELYKALMTLGRELDSEAIAWAIQERTHREQIAEMKKERAALWR